MKRYFGLMRATLQGLVVIGAVSWLLLEFRHYFVDTGPRIPWAIFLLLLGGALGGAVGYAGKACLHEVEKLKNSSR